MSLHMDDRVVTPLPMLHILSVVELISAEGEGNSYKCPGRYRNVSFSCSL